MPTNDFVFLLQSFEQQLEKVAPQDQQVAQDVLMARKQIQEILSNPDCVPEPDEYLVSKLSDVARHFEMEHPILTEWVGRLSDLFSRIGL